MRMTRVWAMPSRHTFSIKPIKELIQYYIDKNKIWIDPFCGNSIFAEQCSACNDLSPLLGGQTLEALEFLKSFETASIDGVLFDPPYSMRQISECYKSIGLKVHQSDTQASWYSKKKKEIARIMKPGGIALSFGWNSGGIGKTNGFGIEEILLVPHGGPHYDTIVTVERKLK